MILLNKREAELLAAFARQADLSLDRSRWNLWQQLQAFYKVRKSLDISKKIISYFLINKTEGLLAKNTTLKLIRIIFLFTTRKFFLTDSEGAFIANALINLDKILQVKENYDLDVEKTRVMFAHIYSKIFKLVINKNIESVEHFMQHDDNAIKFFL